MQDKCVIIFPAAVQLAYGALPQKFIMYSGLLPASLWSVLGSLAVVAPGSFHAQQAGASQLPEATAAVAAPV